MAINLVKKYHDKLVKSLEYATNLAGKTTDEYKLDGGEGVYLTSLVPQSLNNYNMGAALSLVLMVLIVLSLALMKLFAGEGDENLYV